MDPFPPIFYSPIQNNMSPNFSDGLNFGICEHSYNLLTQCQFLWLTMMSEQGFKVMFCIYMITTKNDIT